MQDILDRLAAVPGVDATVLYERGALLVGRVTPPFDTAPLTRSLELLHTTADYCCGIPGAATVQAMAVRLARGHLLLRRASQYELLVACQLSANLAMVGVALNVATMKLKQTATASAPSSVTAPISTAPPAALNGAPGPATVTPSPAAQPMTWSTDQPPRRGSRSPVGLKVMQHVLTIYLRYLGPAAQLTLEGELRRLGHTPQSLDATLFADLITAAAAHIDDPKRRKQFIADVLGDAGRRRR